MSDNVQVIRKIKEIKDAKAEDNILFGFPISRKRNGKPQ